MQLNVLACVVLCKLKLILGAYFVGAWAEYHSRYSDWIRTGRSGDRIPVVARFSAPVQAGPGAHPASCAMGTGYFSGVMSGWVVTLTPHPLLVPLVMKVYSYTSTPPVGRTACTEPQCLYKGALYLYCVGVW
jgi:hypothetical protein